jgi:hypothetical protein
MTMENPMDFTQGDLAGLMDAGQALVNMPGVSSGSSPMGGIGEMLDTVQRILNMAGQFNDSVDRFGSTIAKFKGMDMPGMNQPQETGFFPAGQVIDGDLYRPPDRPITMPSPEPEPVPGPEPTPAPVLEPQKIYSKALGWLAQLPENMTMKEALELARSNKGMILGAIEKELPDLLGTDGPSE